MIKIPKRFTKRYWNSHTIKFNRGVLRGLTEQERALALKLMSVNVKNLKDDDEIRIYYRLLLFICGESMNIVPKEGAKECPTCGDEIEFMVERHMEMCKAKEKIAQKNKAKIDPMVWELLGGKLWLNS